MQGQNSHQPVSYRKEKETDRNMYRLEITETVLWMFEEKSVSVLRYYQNYTQDVETLRISRQTVHEGGKVVSPTHRPPLTPPRSTPGTHFYQGSSRPQRQIKAGSIKSMPHRESKPRDSGRSAVPSSDNVTAFSLWCYYDRYFIF